MTDTAKTTGHVQSSSAAFFNWIGDNLIDLAIYFFDLVFFFLKLTPVLAILILFFKPITGAIEYLKNLSSPHLLHQDSPDEMFDDELLNLLFVSRYQMIDGVVSMKYTYLHYGTSPYLTYQNQDPKDAYDFIMPMAHYSAMLPFGSYIVLILNLIFVMPINLVSLFFHKFVPILPSSRAIFAENDRIQNYREYTELRNKLAIFGTNNFFQFPRYLLSPIFFILECILIQPEYIEKVKSLSPNIRTDQEIFDSLPKETQANALIIKEKMKQEHPFFGSNLLLCVKLYEAIKSLPEDIQEDEYDVAIQKHLSTNNKYDVSITFKLFYMVVLPLTLLPLIYSLAVRTKRFFEYALSNNSYNAKLSFPSFWRTLKGLRNLSFAFLSGIFPARNQQLVIVHPKTPCHESHEPLLNQNVSQDNDMDIKASFNPGHSNCA